MKCQETWECDDFPRARLSFERAPYFRPTHFASVGDILKAVDEENRRNSRYCHLGFAIWTDFSSRHYGEYQVDSHDASFRPTNVAASKKAHPGLGACQSEKQELEISPVALRQRLDHRYGAPIIHKSREKSYDVAGWVTEPKLA
jgi:hypothetical protein